MCNNIPSDPAEMRAYSPPLPGSSNPITQLFCREISSFGFLCHLYLEDNKFLDTLTMADPKYSEKRQIFPFTVIATRPQNNSSGNGANASLTFDRKFVASELRQIGIVERGNLVAGCVHSGEDNDDITSETSANMAATPTPAYSMTLTKETRNHHNIWNGSQHMHENEVVNHHHNYHIHNPHTQSSMNIKDGAGLNLSDDVNVANNDDENDLNMTEMVDDHGEVVDRELAEGEDGKLVYLTALKYGLDLVSNCF